MLDSKKFVNGMGIIMSYKVTTSKLTAGFLTVALTLSFVNTIDMSEAQAAEKKRKNLLELLFPKAAKRAEQRKQRDLLRNFDLQQAERRKNAAPIKKVEGAKYYTYKVEGFRSLKLAGVISAAAAMKPAIDEVEQSDLTITALSPIAIALPITTTLPEKLAPEVTSNLVVEGVELSKPVALKINNETATIVSRKIDEETASNGIKPHDNVSNNGVSTSVDSTGNILSETILTGTVSPVSEKVEKSLAKVDPINKENSADTQNVTIANNEIADYVVSDAVADVKPLGAQVKSHVEAKTLTELSETELPETELAKPGMQKIVQGPHILAVSGLEKANLRGESKLLSQVEKHYIKNPEYIWIDRNYATKEVVEVVLNVFETADAYGLNPASYQLRSIGQLMDTGLDLEQAATQFELSLTVNVLRYMADAHSGVINPNKISGYHDFKSYNRNYKKHLSALVTADLPARAMFDAHPNNQHFKNLKSELEILLETEDDNTLEPIAAGTLLKPGNANAELPKVIAAISKFGSKDFLTQNSEFFTNYAGSQDYDDATVRMVKAYQAEKKLTPDGIVGSQTLNTLRVVSAATKISKINLAMERLRWLPNKFGRRHVFINQPAYRASYIVDGKSKLSMRAIVGKKANQTNFFHDTIESVEFNPYWNVPRSILVNEKLSRLQADPYYYQARGYEVVRHGGKPVDPASINWFDDSSTKKYYVRQLPGAKNALGELKILFPNKHNIYMHDTPSRSLFKRNRRALSHGCIRLHKPRDMAAAVMQTSVKKVTGFINAGENKAMRVPNKLPVYVSYFTAFPRSNGNIGYYSDIYGRDIALKKALKAISDARVKASTS